MWPPLPLELSSINTRFQVWVICLISVSGPWPFWRALPPACHLARESITCFSCRDGSAFHNTPEQGEHLDLLGASLKGLPAWRWDIAPEHQVAAHARLIEALENPRPYHGFLNNCQHTVSRIVTGVAQSPTLRAVVLCMGIAGFIGIACQADKPTRLCR